jgi:hypothetical protein
MRLLNDQKLDGKLLGVSILGLSKDNRAPGGLLMAIDTPDLQVRMAAAEALEAMGWKPRTPGEQILFYRGKQDWDALARMGKVGLDALAEILIPLEQNEDTVALYNSVSDALHKAGDPRGDQHWFFHEGGGYQDSETYEWVSFSQWKFQNRTDDVEKGTSNDSAMFDAPSARDVGGIDIKNIGLNKKSSGSKIQLNDEAMKVILDGRFDGFTPVFVQMTPLDNPLTIMGVN